MNVVSASQGGIRGRLCPALCHPMTKLPLPTCNQHPPSSHQLPCIVVAARRVLRGRGLERGGQRDGGEGRGPHRCAARWMGVMRAADESSLPRLLRASLWGLPVAARDVVASRCERAARVWLRWRWWRVIVRSFATSGLGARIHVHSADEMKSSWPLGNWRRHQSIRPHHPRRHAAARVLNRLRPSPPHCCEGGASSEMGQR